MPPVSSVRLDLKINDLTQLANVLVANIVDGSNAFVVSEGDYWIFFKNDGTPVGPNVIAPTYGGANDRWIRQSASSAGWQLELTGDVVAGPGNSPLATTVVGLQGYAIQSTMPNNGEALIYNSLLSEWEHAPIVFGGGPPVGPASGDLGGIYPNPSVVGFYTRPLSAAAPSVGDAYIWDGANWTPDKVLLDGAAAGGDLDGTYPNPTVDGLQGNPVSAAAPAIGNALIWNGAAWTPTAPTSAAFTPKLGNVAVVDAVNGNDGTASVNGTPYLTIPAALTAIGALGSPGTVWVLPGTYTLSAGITIPDTCALRGMNVQTVKIQWAASVPGGTATLLTMGENTRVEDVTLLLTSTNATTNLVGIALPGTTSNTSKLRTAVLTVNNSGLAVGTSTNVYGILDNGTGSIGPATFSFNYTRGVTINVFSNGGGIKRGVLVNSANDITFRDTNIYVAAPTDAASTGSYVGVETTDPACGCQFRTSSISGPSTAGGYTGSDIAQTSPGTGNIALGIQLGPGCDLVNKTAAGKPFTTYVTPTTLVYSLRGNIAAATRYLWQGVQTTDDSTQVFYRFQQKAIVQGMSFNMRTAAGVGNSVTVTVLKSTTGIVGSGVATAMTATASGTNKSATQYTVSVDFAQGEYLAVQISSNPGTAAQDIVIELDLF